MPRSGSIRRWKRRRHFWPTIRVLECVVRKFDAPRILMEGAYLLLYETHPDTDDGPVDSVEIVRVVNGRRDLTRPF